MTRMTRGVLSLAASVDASPRERLAGYNVIELEEKHVSAETLKRIQASRAVQFVERVPNRWVSARRKRPAADPALNLQWGLRAIDWFAAARRPSAAQVHVAYPETAARLPGRARARVRESGNPVRPPRPIAPTEAMAALSLPAQGRVVLVVGGSQGSRALNQATLDAVRGVATGALSLPPHLQLLWSTGPGHLAGVQAELESLGRPDWVHARGYIDDMEAALSVAEIAVSRAGAMATSEFMAWGVPAVLVPLPTAAADHQTGNARSLAAAGAAIHLAETSLTGASLWREVVSVVGDAERLATLRDASLRRGRPSAAAEIARSLATLLPSARPRRDRPGSPGTGGGS